MHFPQLEESALPHTNDPQRRHLPPLAALGPGLLEGTWLCRTPGLNSPAGASSRAPLATLTSSPGRLEYHLYHLAMPQSLFWASLPICKNGQNDRTGS